MTEKIRSHLKFLIAEFPSIAIIVGWAMMVGGVVWAASADRADVLYKLREQQVTISDHEARLRVLEKQTNEIAADVRWIRQTLEKSKP